MTALAAYRFRPRYRGVALIAAAIGAIFIGVSLVGVGFAITAMLMVGVMGVLLAVAYLASPTWHIIVRVGDDGLEVGTKQRVRFVLPWTDIKRVVASPTTHTCFVDGGSAERSLLVPGDGARAPYWIENRDALFDAICAHVDPARVQIVGSLDEPRTP